MFLIEPVILRSDYTSLRNEKVIHETYCITGVRRYFCQAVGPPRPLLGKTAHRHNADLNEGMKVVV